MEVGIRGFAEAVEYGPHIPTLRGLLEEGHFD